MKYIVIEAPELTDEAAVNMQDFFYAMMTAFTEHYHHQTERFYLESVVDSMTDNLNLTEDDPPF